MLWLAALVLILVIAGVGFFTWKKRRADAKVAALRAAKQNLKAGLDNPEMDEDYARQVSADQRARNEGAV